MKRVLFGVAASLALSLQAEFVKVAEVVVAKQPELVEAANKLGAFTGNPTLGMMIAMGIGGAAEEFGLGAMRADGHLMIAGYCDDAAFEDINKPGGFKGAFFYPVAITKEQFLKDKPAAKEADGVIRHKNMTFLFTPDGKYACIVPDGDAAFAKKAVCEFAKKAPSLGKSQTVRVNVTEPGTKILSSLICSQAVGDKKIKNDVLNIFKSLKEVSLTLAVSDKGVDIISSYVGTRASYWDAVGKKTIPAGAALSFAGKDAVFAFAGAADCGICSYGRLWTDFMSLLTKWGFKTDWQVSDIKGSTTKIVFDPVALFNYIKKDAKAFFEKLEGKGEAFRADAEKLFPYNAEAKSQEQSVAAYIKGHKIPVDAQKRFNAVMPEFVGKPCVALGVTSFYGVLKPVGDMILPSLDDKNLAMYKTMFAMFPPAADSTVAFAWTRSDLRHDVTVRINPSEIKGLCSLLTISALSGGSEDAGELDWEDED